MRIAILSSIHWRTPPRKYGPWELITSYISEGMVKRGHQVTLYATGDSETKGNLRWICPRPVSEDPSLEVKVYQYLHSALVFEEADNFDIIHNHYDAYPLVFSKLVKTPVLTTIHGFSSPQVPLIYRKYSNTFFVSISYADRKYSPDLNYIANIYHGIPVEEYQFNDHPKDYFCYIGRISPDKGIHLTVKIAKEMGLNLKIAGLIDGPHQNFFDQEIKPYLNSKIQYLGLLDNQTKRDLLKDAFCFLHLNTYPEGFGLTLTEAMACGTPVIGMNLGSVPEVIENQKTGLIVSSVDEAKEAIRKIGQIQRKDCRERVEKNFSTNRMLDEYEKVYQKVLNQQKDY